MLSFLVWLQVQRNAVPITGLIEGAAAGVFAALMLLALFGPEFGP